MFSALTFNMQNGEPWDGGEPGVAEIDLEGTRDFLREQDADILFLQEVEQGHDGGRQVEPPPHFTWLREELPGYEGVFGYPLFNPDELPFGLGLAIFCRTPLRNFQRLDITAAEIPFSFQGSTRKPSSRLALRADTEISGRTVTLLNAHLQAFFMLDATSDEHREQRDQVERELRGITGAGLMGGDFNSAPGESLESQFEEADFRTCQNRDVTWRRKPFVLDHLFHNASLQAVDCRVVPTLVSDHHAIRADFDFVS